jgi:hypothetical protein
MSKRADAARLRAKRMSQEWNCHICGAMGVGGLGGFQHHYIRQHYREAEAAGYRKRDDR